MQLAEAMSEADITPSENEEHHLTAVRLSDEVARLRPPKPKLAQPWEADEVTKRLRLRRVARNLAGNVRWYSLSPVQRARYLKLAQHSLNAVERALRDEYIEQNPRLRARQRGS